MFGTFLLEAGVEMELQADIKEVLGLLDEAVPGFVCGGYGYHLSGFNGVLDSQWKMLVNLRDMETWEVGKDPVGFIHVVRLEEGLTGLKIPPRGQWGEGREQITEQEARLFASFIFHLLNALQGRGLIELPGQLPIE